MIAYSMGNFLAHGRDLEARTGAVLEVEVVPTSPEEPAAVRSFAFARLVLGSSIVHH